MRGLIRIIGFFMVAYALLTVIKIVLEMVWPDKFKSRRRKK